MVTIDPLKERTKIFLDAEYESNNYFNDNAKYVITQTFRTNLNDLGLKGKFDFRDGDYLYFDPQSNYDNLDDATKNEIIKLANLYGYINFQYRAGHAEFLPNDWNNLQITPEIEEEIKKVVKKLTTR